MATLSRMTRITITVRTRLQCSINGSSERIVSFHYQRRLKQVRQQDDFFSTGGQTLKGDILAACRFVVFSRNG